MRDESDRDGMRIVVEVKRGSSPEVRATFLHASCCRLRSVSIVYLSPPCRLVLWSDLYDICSFELHVATTGHTPFMQVVLNSLYKHFVSACGDNTSHPRHATGGAEQPVQAHCFCIW